MGDHNLPNKQVCLREYPEGGIKEEHFEVTTSSTSKILKEGSQDVLLKNIFLSLDPYMRNLMDDPKKKNSLASYIGPFELHKVTMARTSFTGQRLILIERPQLPSETGSEGTMFSGAYHRFLLCVLAMAHVLKAAGVSAVVASAHPEYQEGDIVQGYVGWEEYTLVEGGKGLRKLPPGVAPASYYLGLVGQLAKLSGCYVVGSAGSAQKVELLKTYFGFDDAFNYKEEPDFNAALKRYLDRMPQFLTNMGAYMADKKIKYLEDVTNGIENAPAAFVGMLHGLNVGKAVVRIAPPFS
eukprot:jgi/Mesen1/6971/ME000361S06125